MSQNSQLKKLGIASLLDLALILPKSYDDQRRDEALQALREEESQAQEMRPAFH